MAPKFQSTPPRVGGDCPGTGGLPEAWHFNPRPPRGGRHVFGKCRRWDYQFQSTPPAWGATIILRSQPRGSSGFNPRPPRGGRQELKKARGNAEEFQSTPPAWGATAGQPVSIPLPEFQSTPPAWGATASGLDWPAPDTVSIHAPRVGGDLRRGAARLVGGVVSIHAPRVGGDNPINAAIIRKPQFQSTPPAWGATTYRPEYPG